MIDLYKIDYLEIKNNVSNLIEKEIERQNIRIDSLILEALSFVYGENFSIGSLKGRGQIFYYEGGSRQFIMDGKVLLEFHKINGSTIFYREYKKIKNDFNECLPIGHTIKSEIL